MSTKILNKVQTMQYQKQKLERDLHVIQKQVIELTDVESMHQHNIDTLQNDIEHIYNERQFVSKFKNNNKTYLQIKRMAEEIVDRLLAERKSLLTSALIAVVEALRMNPDRYKIIYNSKYDSDDNISNSSTTIAPILSSSSTYSTSTKAYQNYYYN